MASVRRGAPDLTISAALRGAAVTRAAGGVRRVNAPKLDAAIGDRVLTLSCSIMVAALSGAAVVGVSSGLYLTVKVAEDTAALSDRSAQKPYKKEEKN